MRIRPTSVTVIGWFLVVTALLSLPSEIRNIVSPRESVIAAKSPVPVSVQRAVSWLATAANLVCGYFLLRGRNWARYVHVGWSVLLLGYGFLAAPYWQFSLLGVVMECLVIYFPFTPQANAFFAVESAGQPIQNEMSGRQIASISLYVASGFWLICGTLVSRFVSQDGFPIIGLVIILQLVLAFILLLIGKLLSPNPNWTKEIGIVLLASAAVAAVFHVALGVFFTSTAFLKSLPPGKPAPEFSYLSAAITVGIMAGFGALLLRVGNRRDRSDRRQARE
jgi:hypothetical protein